MIPYMKHEDEGEAFGERRMYVLVNGERVNADEVETLNIEENFLGQDLLTFKFNGKIYQSLVFTS